MGGRWSHALALGFAAWLVGTPAVAAPGSDAGPSDAVARERLAAGMQKFDDGKFTAAQKEFEASFNTEANPLSLWGWAQATNKAQGCRKAVPLYRRFSKMVDEGSAAYEVALQAIAECADKMLAEGPPPSAPVPVPEPEPVPDAYDDDDSDPDPVSGSDDGPAGERPWHRDPLGGVLVGIGAAGTATGIGLLAAAAADESSPCANYECFEAQQARVSRMRIAGAVVVGVGGALLVGGIVRWAVVGSRQRKRASAAPLLGPRTVGVSLRGRF